jgi:hypothetical protein
VDAWKTKIREREDLGVEAGLPRRRVFAIGGDEMYNKICEEADEERTVIAAYDAWLRAWKGVPVDSNGDNAEWHLCIGMERSKNEVAVMLGEAVKDFESDLIRVEVRSAMDGKRTDDRDMISKMCPRNSGKGEQWGSVEDESNYWKKETSSPPCAKHALVFDNHGNCFKDAFEAEGVTDFRQGTRFYQKLSGTETPDLFRLLSHPPTNTFGFAFFIHALVESCLTNVVVVDERVAADLLFQSDGDQVNGRFKQDLAAHQKAGVFPVFRFRKEKEGQTAKTGHYTVEHYDALAKLLKNHVDVLDNEGIQDADSPAAQCKVLITGKDDESISTLSCGEDEVAQCDVLLVHEGALDLICENVGTDRKKELSKNLHAISPVVVRTSGRGRNSNHLNEDLPFIEFGEVSSALLTSRNKFSLVRGLLGSAGEKKK